MERIQVTISQAMDGSYWCSTDGEVYGAGLNSSGATIDEAKKNLLSCLEEARADFLENGGTPYEVDFTYKYDIQSLFEYFTFLNASDIARRAGINPSLMRQYVCGKKKAGNKTYERLRSCLGGIQRELQVATI